MLSRLGRSIDKYGNFVVQAMLEHGTQHRSH
jgi:hypothetical protein